MKKIFLITFLLTISVCTSAMTEKELNYLKEYPQASKATIVLDYLFIEDSQGNILEQCFLPKSGGKSCFVQDLNKSKPKVNTFNQNKSDSIPLSKPIR